MSVRNLQKIFRDRARQPDVSMSARAGALVMVAASLLLGGGAGVLFDPIFQGLAIALMAGEVASTLLSRTAIPVLYYLMMRRSSSA